VTRPDDHGARIARALQSLEGLSVGDAFGEQVVADLAGAFTRLQQRAVLPGPWRYTDDTVMAISIVETLHEHGRIDQDALARRFGQRFGMDPWRGYGLMAQAILAEIARGRDWREVSRAPFGGAGSMGNGGAMRAAPIGAYFAGDLDAAAREARLAAEVTHAHLEGQVGAMAVAAAAAWVAAAPFEPDGFFDAVLGVLPASQTRDAIARAAGLGADVDTIEAVGVLGNGLRVTAQDTVPFALWCARHSLRDYAGALWKAVSHFGDCDTLCAIVGGITALHPGAPGIPDDWSRRREPLSTFLRLGEPPAAAP
jgi:ADP-ribosylglycohydrolase